MKRLSLSTILVAPLLVACDGGGQPAASTTTKPANKPAASTTASPKSAAATNPPPTKKAKATPEELGDDDAVDPQKTATVKGTVLFKGTPPAVRKVRITKDEGACGKGEREIVDVDVADGMVRGAVVYVGGGELDGIEAKGAPPKLELVQEACRFTPHITIVPKGHQLDILNKDAVPHYVHAYTMLGRAKKALFNVSQPTQGHRASKLVEPDRGNVIQLTCNVHDFMEGWLFVAENPFAVLAEDGTFTLEAVPAGKRTIKVFHPKLGTLAKQPNLPAGGEATVEFTFE